MLEITPELVFEFQQKRLAEGVGKATVNRDFATLSSALTPARKLRLITHNPCVDVGKLNERRERRQAKPLSYEEEARVKQFAPRWLSVLITVLAETGLRVKKVEGIFRNGLFSVCPRPANLAEAEAGVGKARGAPAYKLR